MGLLLGLLVGLDFLDGCGLPFSLAFSLIVRFRGPLGGSFGGVASRVIENQYKNI